MAITSSRFWHVLGLALVLTSLFIIAFYAFLWLTLIVLAWTVSW